MSKVEVKPKELEIEYIVKWYGIKQAREMAEDLNISTNRVYNICRYLEMKPLNRQIIFTVMQYQLVLGGILGDGNIKRNGSNYYYREAHAKKEYQYIEWKYNIMKNMVSKSGFHMVDNRDGQYGFQTINSPTFKYFKKLTITDVINELSVFGALIYLLDDGWAKPVGYALSTGVLTDDEVDVLIGRLNELFKIHCHKIKDNTITIVKEDIVNVLVQFKKYIPNTIDIYIHKIQPLIDKFKV